MLNLSNHRIFIARESTDMRRGIDTLASVVASAFQHDPYQGDVFVFLGRDRKRVKILVWDHSGFWLAMKRLESGTFAPPALPVMDVAGHPVHQISAAELQMVLEGIVVHRATYHPHYHRSAARAADTPPLTAAQGAAIVRT